MSLPCSRMRAAPPPAAASLRAAADQWLPAYAAPKNHPRPVHHFDLYRLSKPEDVAPLASALSRLSSPPSSRTENRFCSPFSARPPLELISLSPSLLLVFLQGLPDSFGASISLVEWPDRLGHLSPPDRLDVAITPLPQPLPPAPPASLPPRSVLRALAADDASSAAAAAMASWESSLEEDHVAAQAAGAGLLAWEPPSEEASSPPTFSAPGGAADGGAGGPEAGEAFHDSPLEDTSPRVFVLRATGPRWEGRVEALGYLLDLAEAGVIEGEDEGEGEGEAKKIRAGEGTALGGLRRARAA